MASEISKGRLLNTKEGFSGIKAVSFYPYTTAIRLTASDYFEGTGLTGSVYRYEVFNDSSSYDVEGDSSDNTGTTVYSGTINLTLPILDSVTSGEVKLLAYRRPHIFIEKYDGTLLLAGAKNGCSLEKIKMGTGAKHGDLSGFTLQFKASETTPLVFCGVTGSNAYNASVSTGSSASYIPAINPTL